MQSIKIYIHIIILFKLFLCSQFGYTQEKLWYSLSGYVINDTSHERLINANVFTTDKEYGTMTNKYGFFSIALPEGTHVIKASYVGFNGFTDTITMKSDTVLEITLSPSLSLQEIKITENTEFHTLQTSKIRVPIKQVESLPTLMGETDILKAARSYPGIQPGVEGFSGMYVRGGGRDQNLILLDEVEVFNPNHLFGMYSLFNSDAIKSAEIYKGGFPAQYGGRSSSVMDIRMKEGNMKEFHGEGSVGLISSKVMLEGPIQENKTSLLISGRRTYFDLFTKPIQKLSATNNIFGYFFHDLNAKVNHIFSSKSRLFISAFTSKDKLSNKYSFTDETGETEITNNEFGWKNYIGSLRWNYRFTENLFSNTSVNYSYYSYFINNTYTLKRDDLENINRSAAHNSGIRNLSTKIDFDYSSLSDHYVLFGIHAHYQNYHPHFRLNSGLMDLMRVDSSYFGTRITPYRVSAYCSDKVQLFENLKMRVGLRGTGYFVEGHSRYSLQPRFSAQYLFSDNVSIQTSVAKMNQYTHLVTPSKVSLPSDVWIPATRDIKPINSWHYVIGTDVSVFSQFSFSVEGFYKTMSNVTAYREGIKYYSLKPDLADNFYQGTGESWGGELFIKKPKGIITGTCSYTYAKSVREFAELNEGNPFPYSFDRRHTVNIILNYSFTENIKAHARWRFASGRPITFSYQDYLSSEELYRGKYSYKKYKFNAHFRDNSYYPSRNNLRLPSYHRLNISVSFKKKTKWGTRKWHVGLYNAYCRLNPTYVVEYSGDFYQTTLFPVIPFVKYSFSF